MKWRHVLILLLAVLPLLPGCQKQCKPGEDADCWIAVLKDAEQAQKAVDNLKQIGDKKAEPALIDLFSASANEPELREKLAEVFKKWETKAAVKPMIEALDFTVGPNKDGRKAKRTNRANQKIASALGALGDPSASAALLRLMKATKEPNVQRAAIRGLASVKAKDAVDELIKLSEDTTTNQIIRKNAMYALGEIGDPRAVPTLVLSLYREKAYYFDQAGLALVKIGEPAIDLLVKTMNGENQEAKKITEQNVDVLAGALEANSAKVLGDIGSPQAVDPLVKMAEKVAKWEAETNRMIVLARLILSMGNIGDPRAIKLILSQMDYMDPGTKEFLWDVRSICAQSLINISDRSVIPELWKSLAKGGHPRTRTPLIEAIGNLGTDEQLPVMKELLGKEKDITMQPAIQDSVKRLEAYGQCKQEVSCWIGKLASPETPVREKAIYEIGRLGDPKAADELTKYLGDETESVRFALIFALDKLKMKKPIVALQKQVDKEKGSARYAVVDFNYQLLMARLSRAGK